MKDIVVLEGEYEFLIENDPKFREFVKRCEGKSIPQILVDENAHENAHDFLQM